MSGYLQRLATNAARPERRVQPLVGSLYTKQPEQMIEEASTTIVPRPAESNNPLLPLAARPIGPKTSSHEAKVEEIVARNASIETVAAPIVEESHRRPILVPTEQKSASVTRHQGRAESPERNREAALAAPDLLVALSQFINSPSTSRPNSSSKDQPLVDDLSRFAESDELPPIAPLKSVGSGPMRTSTRQHVAHAQPQPPARMGGDDIQIHIGRIEVIAVPQQVAPRPAAAPTQRGPSLAEYLKIRDRRSR